MRLSGLSPPLLGGVGGLGRRIAALENELVGTDREEVASVVASHGFTPETFSASLLIREELGKLSDLIHATGIALALPHLLEPHEVLKTPSLAAGNDPKRLYDVETNIRVAEFKLARWTNGGNGGREKDLFKDLVLLTQAPARALCRPALAQDVCAGHFFLHLDLQHEVSASLIHHDEVRVVVPMLRPKDRQIATLQPEPERDLVGAVEEVGDVSLCAAV